MKMILNLLVLSCFLFTNVFAAGLPLKPQTDEFILGKDGSTDDKKITVNVGDGVLNPKIEVDSVTKKFEFNKGVDVTGDVSATGNISGVDITGTGNATLGGDLTVTGGDINIGSGTNKLRVDGGKLQFSNDGSIYKNIGSGSGGDGGVNIIENESFEDGLPSSSWATSGGTFTAEDYTNPAGNELKYARFVSTVAGEYFETTLKAIPDFGTGGCLAKINYNTVDVANWKIQVYDGVGPNLLKEETLYAKNWQDGFASFPCPTAGTLVKARVISLAAGQIEADKAYLGKENRTFQIAQAQIAGEAYFPTATSCQWSKTGTALGEFAANSNCPGPIISHSSIGEWQTTDTDLPRVTVNNLPAGKYLATFNLTTYQSGVGNNNAIAITDGTTTCTPIGATYDVTAKGTVVSCVFDYSTRSNRTFTILGSTVGNTLIIGNQTIAGANWNTKFILQYYPNSSQTALVPEAQDWFIDANLGGLGAAPSLGTATIATYTGITHPSLDLILNAGSASAKVPCSSTNPATGLTCAAGDESLGIVFTPPTPGLYEVCADFSYYGAVGTTSNFNTVFQLVETSPNTQTIIQEGKTRVMAHNQDTSVFPFHLCGTFKFDSVSEKTVRLMFEQVISGTVTSSDIRMDRNVSLGQRDMHFVVRPLLSAYNRPYLVSDKYTYVGAAGNAGQSITANSTNIPFIEVEDTKGAWDGTQFTVPETGIYSISGSAYYSTTATRFIDLYVNGSSSKRVSDSISNSGVVLFSYVGKLEEGQIISFKEASGSSGGTLLNNSSYHYLTINRAPGSF